MKLPSFNTVIKKEKKKLPTFDSVVKKGKLPSLSEVVKTPSKPSLKMTDSFTPYVRLRERTTLENAPKDTLGNALLGGLATGITFGAGGDQLRKTTKYDLATIVGELGGSIAPIGKLYQGASKLAKPITNSLLNVATKGAITGAGLGAGKSTLEGEDLKGIAKETAIYGALGAVLDPAIEKLALPLIKKGFTKAVDVLTKQFKANKINKQQLESQLKSLDQLPKGKSVTQLDTQFSKQFETPNILQSKPSNKTTNLSKLEGIQSSKEVAPTKVEEDFILSTDKKTFNLKNKWDNFYENTINTQSRLANISPATKVKASNSRQTQGVLDYIGESGLVNKEGQKIGESLTELIQSIPLNKERNFWRYKGHKHNVARAAEGKNLFSQFGPDDSIKEAQNILRDNPEFEQSSKKVTEWINKFMDNWATDLIGEDTLKTWKAMYPDYFPGNRVMDKLTTANVGNNAKRGFVNQNNLIKKAKGAKADGSSNINDPAINIAQLVNKTVKAAKNNEVGLEILTEIEKGNLEDIFEVVTTKQDMLEGINKTLKDEGIEGVMANLADQFDDIFKQAEKGNNIVKVMKNGKEVSIKVKDADYLKALKSLSEGTGQSAAEQFEKVARKVTRPIKDLITGKNPLFAVFNVIRDTPTAFIQGQENNIIKF